MGATTAKPEPAPATPGWGCCGKLLPVAPRAPFEGVPPSGAWGWGLEDGSADVCDFRGISLAWLHHFYASLISEKVATGVSLVEVVESVHLPDGQALPTGLRGKLLAAEGAPQEHPGDVLMSAAQAGQRVAVLVPHVGRVMVSAAALQPVQRQHWTTENVCEYAVVQANPELMAAKRCFTWLLARDAGPRHVGPRFGGAFVSQARHTQFADLLKSLDAYYVDHSNEACFVWLDVFGANQGVLRGGGTTAAERAAIHNNFSRQLHAAIAKFDEMLLFWDSWPQPVQLTRAWCMWEAYGAAVAGKTVHVALPPEQTKLLRDALVSSGGLKLAEASIAAVAVQNASCSSAADLAMIQGEVTNNVPGGHAAVNRAVKGALTDWLMRTAEGFAVHAQLQLMALLRQPDTAHSPDHGALRDLDRKRRCVQYNASELLQRHGRIHEAEALLFRALCTVSDLRRQPQDGALEEGTKSLLLARVLELTDRSGPGFCPCDVSCGAGGHDGRWVWWFLASTLSSLAAIMRSRGNVDGAERVMAGVVKINRWLLAQLQADRQGAHEAAQSLAAALHTLGAGLAEREDWDRSLPFLKEAVHLSERHSPASSALAEYLSELARVLAVKGALPEARAMCKRALDIQRVSLGGTHAHTLKTLSRLAGVEMEAGKTDAALDLWREVLVGTSECHGEVSKEYGAALDQLGDTLYSMGRVEEAAGVWDSAAQVLRAVAVADGGTGAAVVMQELEMGRVLDNAAIAWRDLGRLDQAEERWQQCLELFHATGAGPIEEVHESLKELQEQRDRR